MPAPITSVLTNFTGADENPLSEGGAWTNVVVTGEGNLKRLSNQLAWASASRGSAWWNGTKFVADQEAFFTVPTLPTSDIGLYLRLASPGGSANGYMAWYSVGNGYRIWKLSGGSYSALSSYVTTPTLVAGDKLAFSAVGNTLKLARYDGSSWTDLITVTDSSYPSSGYIGILGDNDTTWRIDDFGGGSVVTRTVIDNFNRADENPVSDSGKWSHKVDLTDGSGLKLVSNQLTHIGSGWNVSYRNDATYTDVEPEVKLATAGADGVLLWARVTNPFSGTLTGYLADFDFAVGTLTIYKCVSGTYTSLGATSLGAATSGDVLSFYVFGTTLVARKNGVSIKVITDSAISAAGYVAVGKHQDSGGVIFDDFAIYQASAGSTNYTDSATISSVTTPSIVDVSADVDSATIITKTTPSGIEFPQPEQVTIPTITTVSGSDSFSFSDAITISSVTTPGGTELKAHDYSDSATIPSKVSFSGLDEFSRTDAATITSRTSLRTVEIYTQILDYTVTLNGLAFEGYTLTGTITIGSGDIVQGGGGTATGEPATDPIVVSASGGSGDTDSGSVSGLPSYLA